MCPNCPHYEARQHRILITKLDAIGDVLRTTALLPGLKQAYPDSYIVWTTRGIAADLFRNNPYVDELWVAETETLARLQTERFALVINPDADRWTAALASAAQADERRGFVLDPAGSVVPVNPAAEEWLEMGAFDQRKRANNKSYQQIIYEIAGLPYDTQRIVLRLTDDERAGGKSFPAGQGWSGRPLVALNLGGGGRWKRKRWTEPHLLEFGRLIQQDGHYDLLLIGGPFEKDLLQRMADQLGTGVLTSGPNLLLRQTASLIAHCALVVTGDTLALHMATALDVPVVALFGPTSATEIELYGRGCKIIAPAPCVCCYRTSCDVAPDCMEQILPSSVYAQAKAVLAHPPSG